MHKDTIKGVFTVVKTIIEVMEELVINRLESKTAVAAQEIKAGQLVVIKETADEKVLAASPALKTAFEQAQELLNAKEVAAPPTVSTTTAAAPTALPAKPQRVVSPEARAKQLAGLEKAREMKKAAKAAAEQGKVAPIPAAPPVPMSPAALPVKPPAVPKATKAPAAKGPSIQIRLILESFAHGPKPLNEIRAIAHNLFIAENILDFEKHWTDFTTSGKDYFQPNGWTPSKVAGPNGEWLYGATPPASSFFG